MKTIKANTILKTVSQLSLEANFNLRKDVLAALRAAHRTETNGRAKKLLKAIIDNAAVATNEQLAVCQDTGLPVVFAEIGQNVKIIGDLKKAINQGVEQGYRKGFLRDSIIKEPLLRGKPGFFPAIIHFDLVKGNKLKLTVFPKGFGCENKGQVKMFRPTTDIREIKNFIVGTVKDAGPDACPPFVVGVGIGGTQDYACLLAKKALLRKISSIEHPAKGEARQKRRASSIIAKLEQDLLKEINRLNIGPMGLGGKATALAVNIETFPTHIAGLPVAVNISCHALRSATKTI